MGISDILAELDRLKRLGMLRGRDMVTNTGDYLTQMTDNMRNMQMGREAVAAGGGLGYRDIPKEEQTLRMTEGALDTFGGGLGTIVRATAKKAVKGLPSLLSLRSATEEADAAIAAPNELGLTTMGFDPMDEGKLVAETTKAFRESGIPRAESILGEGRSGFQELPWGAEGAGTATEAALRPLLQLPDSAVQNLDRTGQFQEASRLLNAADSRFSDRYGIPARQDLLTLRDIVRTGGLSGLLNRVKTQGYAGLPAVGAGGIALDEDERKRWSW